MMDHDMEIPRIMTLILAKVGRVGERREKREGRGYQLFSKERHVLDDGQSDPPFGVLSQLHNGWQQRRGQLTNADHWRDGGEGKGRRENTNKPFVFHLSRSNCSYLTPISL